VTNVIKHGRASTCTIRIAHDGGAITLEITDDGRGAQQGMLEPAGSGLAGLRERVAALGGSCQAGPLPEGGFRLAVTVPLSATREGQAARSA
jgi:signal transduction histidine kinase